eukprot:gene12632-3705_t
MENAPGGSGGYDDKILEDVAKHTEDLWGSVREKREHAEAALKEIFESVPSDKAFAKYIIENSEHDHSLLYACHALEPHIHRCPGHHYIPTAVFAEFHTWILLVLENRSKQLEPFVTKTLIKIWLKMLVTEWRYLGLMFGTPGQDAPLEPPANFPVAMLETDGSKIVPAPGLGPGGTAQNAAFQASSMTMVRVVWQVWNHFFAEQQDVLLGLYILTELVQEMDTPSLAKSYDVMKRKTVFVDSGLRELMLLAAHFLDDCVKKGEEPSAELQQTLDLLLACLSFSIPMTLTLFEEAVD